MVIDKVESAGVTLKVLRTEIKQDAPTVLFVNAVGMETVLFEGLAREFGHDGFNLVTWELRGSPNTGADPQDCSLPAHVRDGLNILARFGVGRLHLAGWCTGASVALFLAKSLGERALSLISVDGAYLFGGTPGAPLGNAMYEMCCEIAADVRLGPKYYELTRPRGNEAAVLGLAAEPGLVKQVTLPYRQGVDDLVRYAFAIRAACDYDPALECSQIICPTLFMARRDDRMVNYRRSLRAADLARRSSLAVAEKGGHYGLFLDKGVVSQMIGFMRSTGGCLG